MTLELNHPGVFIEETFAAPSVNGLGNSVAAFVGVAQKGPSTLKLITSLKQFEQTYGGPFKISGTYQMLWFAVSGYFANGGNACYVVRVVPANAVKATAYLGRLQSPDSPPVGSQSGIVTSLGEGASGNNISVYAKKEEVLVAAAATTDPVIELGVEVEELGALEVGDLIFMQSTPNAVGVIAGFDTTGANPKILLANDNFSNDFAIGESILTSSTHRFKGQLTVALACSGSTVDFSNGLVKVKKGSASDLIPGQLITITGSELGTGNPPRAALHFVVTNIGSVSDGDIIYGTQIGTKTGTATNLPVGTTVVSQEFDLKVFDSNFLKETHRYLSISSLDDRDFVGGQTTNSSTFLDGRLYGTNNQSNLIQFEIAAGSSFESVDVFAKTPCTHIPVFLASGADGTLANLTDSIYTAGIDLVDDADEATILVAPDAYGNTVVSEYLLNKAEASTYKFAIIDPPLTESEGDDAVTNIVDWKQNTLNVNSSYGALYWPWLIVPDPAGKKNNVIDPNAYIGAFGQAYIKVPPSGHVAGLYSFVSANLGVHVTPANIPLKGVLDVTKRIGDTDQDFLNPIGINAIRAFAGEGIMPFGGRTLSAILNGYHYISVRRTVNFIKRAVKKLNKPFVFRPNDPIYYSLIKSVNEDYLTSLWRNGILTPSDNISKAFFVKCDSSVTTQADINAGRINVLIGVNPPRPAEFIVFSLSIYDGDNSLSEVSTGINTLA